MTALRFGVSLVGSWPLREWGDRVVAAERTVAGCPSPKLRPAAKQLIPRL